MAIASLKSYIKILNQKIIQYSHEATIGNQLPTYVKNCQKFSVFKKERGIGLTCSAVEDV